MKQEEFKKLIKLMISTSERTIDVFRNHSVNLIDYDHDYYNIIDILGNSFFSEDGWELIMSKIYNEENKNLNDINIDDLYQELINKKYLIG
jgi:uncharacterized protein YvpB